MKRLAIITAVSHFNGNGNHHNSTMTTTTISATGISLAGNIVGFNRNNSSSSSSGSYSQQFGGLGLLHQQNLRTGGNTGLGGFTVGGIGGGAPVMGSSSSGSNSGGSNNINGNVNVLLGGAMLTVVTTVLCVVCYCCHRNIKKRTEAAYRQRWMENDANMEIYSVEQCYETSGLFMESSEGLAVPALSHEPPPSYDAVVAMQEENQPTRISPPPDYRSMNDVSGSSNANEIPKFIRGSNLLEMKKVLSAQSCCSLQRAEAENLFQLGVAAGVSALGRKSLQYTAPESTGVIIGESRFVNHQAYYRGCPLCGKFRYDDSMSLSSDSGMDQVVVEVDVNNGKSTCYCTPLQSPTIDDRNNNVDPECGSVSHAPTDDHRMAEVNLRENIINNNSNSGGNGDDTPTTSAFAASTSDNYRDTADVTLDLDSINDNGIIRLDMSKIIDKTGLPTYEAALKLESSGYV